MVILAGNLPLQMNRLERITPQSWTEDVRLVLEILVRAESPQVTERAVTECLNRRYTDSIAPDAILAVTASVNWLVGNWDELGRAGLRVAGPEGSTFLDPILVVLEKLVFSDPSPHWWSEVARYGAGHQIREARRLLEAEQGGQKIS